MLFRHRREDRILRVTLVGPERIFRPRHRHRVVVAGAAFGAHEIIVLPVPGQVRGLKAPAIRPAAPDAPRKSHDGLCLRIILHDADRAGLFIVRPRLPVERYQIFAPVGVVKQGRVKPRGVQVNRLAPRTFDVLCRDEIVIDVKISGVHRVHDAVDHVEEVFLLRVGEARRPDSLGGGESCEVTGLLVREDMGIELPVLHVPGVIHRDSRKPLEAGHRDIVVIALAADAGVGVKTGQDRVFDLHAGIPPFAVK